MKVHSLMDAVPCPDTQRYGWSDDRDSRASTLPDRSSWIGIVSADSAWPTETIPTVMQVMVRARYMAASPEAGTADV